LSPTGRAIPLPQGILCKPTAGSSPNKDLRGAAATRSRVFQRNRWFSASPLSGGNATEADLALPSRPLTTQPGRADRYWRNLKTFLRRAFGSFCSWPDLGSPRAALIDLFDADFSAPDALWLVYRDREQAATLAGAALQEPI
jgi:hypothetical protein